MPDGWSQWALASHQLRRGFAILYYHGYRLASLDDLSLHLRHYDPSTTYIYIHEVIAGRMTALQEIINAATQTAMDQMSQEDRKELAAIKKMLNDLADRAEMFDESRSEEIVHRMLRSFRGEERPVGRGAGAMMGDLQSMIAVASARVRIGSRSNHPDAVEESLIDLLRDYAHTHRLDPVPGVSVHCRCRPNNAKDLSTAACRQKQAEYRLIEPVPVEDLTPEAHGPDCGFASTHVCVACVHCVLFDDDQQAMKAKSASLHKVSLIGASQADRDFAELKFGQLVAGLSEAGIGA